jgi:hypothetical protein
MLSNAQGMATGIIAIGLIWLYLLIRHGPVAALGACMVLSFAFPVWLKIDIGGMPVNIRTAVAIFNMAGFLLYPRRFHLEGKILVPLTLLDCGIAMMYLTHLASDTFSTGFTPFLLCRSYGEWVLPYVAGRYAVRNRNDLTWIAIWIGGLLLLLGAMACIESLTKVNPFEFVFGNRPTELAGRNASRFGLKRAFGPATHPIFFGMMIAVLMPWLACLWHPFESRQTRVIGVLAGVAAFTGIIFTG